MFKIGTTEFPSQWVGWADGRPFVREDDAESDDNICAVVLLL